MPNSFVIFAVASAASWLLGTCTLPRSAHSADTDHPATNSTATGSSSSLDTHRAPVPIVRKATELPFSATTTVEPPLPPPDTTDEPRSAAGAVELPVRVEFTGMAAKAAVEADGYKRVTVLGRKPDGTWQMKAYRGDTEVVVTVDGAGTVATE